MLHHVLVPLDGTDTSLEALDAATPLARALHLIHPDHFCSGTALMWKGLHPWPSRSTKLCVYMKP